MVSHELEPNGHLSWMNFRETAKEETATPEKKEGGWGEGNSAKIDKSYCCGSGSLGDIRKVRSQ